MSARPSAYIPAVGPRMHGVLWGIFALFAVLAVDSLYLSGVTVLEWRTGETYQDYFYQIAFLVHLVLGLILVAAFLCFIVPHFARAWPRPNRRAVRAGLGLLAAALAMLGSGFVLTRFEFFEIRDPQVRGVAYWVHVITALAVVWLFVLHRLAGPRIHWRVGGVWLAFACSLVPVMVIVQAQDPRRWSVAGPAEGLRYFEPSLARTATGEFIPAGTLMMDGYCQQCHGDIHWQWTHSVHRLSSFNNPAYLFSVRNTRKMALARDGDVRASRFCAGCHDPVPFFSGAFDSPDFDDVNHPTAHAGVTCTVCHAITHVNSPRGNSDFTIEEPLHYPFAISDSAALRWVNRQLVKAKPDFHKRTFLKPLHRSPEFCGTCHKVHLPEALNHYKWLRGQNHYDTYHLSGVSGHGIGSFYYPPRVQHNCNGCHMPLMESGDFGARVRDESGRLKVHDHMFPTANTAIPRLVGMPDWVVDKHMEFLRGVVRVDIFALRRGGGVDGEVLAPLRPRVPALVPGESYLVEVVVRTLKLGHPLTQGTADSNELWLDVTARVGDRVVGRSGAMDPRDGAVDPWSHFVNAYVLDREGNRIDRRNPEDIFVPLYNHQIPPGAADVVHYRLTVPADASGPLSFEAALRYRKFDTTYVRHFQGDAFQRNDLPVATLGEDRVVFPVAGTPAPEAAAAPEVETWQRWNDYGIALLRKPEKRQLRQAEEAFREVEALGRSDGPVNLARVYLAEGRVDEAGEALARAARHQDLPAPWTVAWLAAQVDEQNGDLDQAIRRLEGLVRGRFGESPGREFDFSQDYRLLGTLGQAVLERARRERGEDRKAARTALLETAKGWFTAVLALDPEDAGAHFNLGVIHRELGHEAAAERHRALHERYRPDDNARDRAISLHRQRNPAADHAANAVVIYDLAPAGRALAGFPDRAATEPGS